MKKLLLASLAVVSMNAFSQSYLVLNNGVTLTTDRAGYIYDFGQFVLPYKVTVNGGSFLVENNKLSTIDGNGYMYDKDEEVKKIKGKGLNYLLTDKSELITVASEGFSYKFDKDNELKKISNFGGNFFLVNSDAKKRLVDIYTVNEKGNYFKMNIPGLNPAEISLLGGTYFVARNNVVHTVSREGFIFAKPEITVGVIRKQGGNFFTDSSNKLFTISESGILANPMIPTTLIVSDIQKVGANYMLDSEGRLFIVDKDGNVAERTIATHDLRSSKILSY